MGVKYAFGKSFKNMTKTQIKELLEKEILNDPDFQRQIEEVAYLTKVKKSLVLLIITDYITNILIVINSVRKLKTKINLYAFANLILEKGKRV